MERKVFPFFLGASFFSDRFFFESWKLGCHPENFQWFMVPVLQMSLCPMAMLKELKHKKLFKLWY